MNEPSPVTLPTIHRNGTDAANLEAEYQAVQEAHAAEALREQRIRNRERARTIAMDHAEARDRHRDHSRDDD
jgi:hypothetical protein